MNKKTEKLLSQKKKKKKKNGDAKLSLFASLNTPQVEFTLHQLNSWFLLLLLFIFPLLFMLFCTDLLLVVVAASKLCIGC